MNLFIELLVTLFEVLKAIFWGVLYSIIPAPEKSVEGNLVLITGSGSGIGRLMAIEFSKLGARIVGWDVNEKGNKETAEIIKNAGGIMDIFVCDISKKEDVKKCSEQVIKEIGQVDILINNAGIVTGKRFLDCPDDMIVKTMEVNTLAHFWTIKAFLPQMLNHGRGHIVAISSLLGISGITATADYGASKGAVLRMMEALEMELMDTNKTHIKTTTVCPYTVKAFLPHMLERNSGHICNIASIAGLVGGNSLADYCASKFANVGFTESLDYEIRAANKDGVCTTTICPFYINTGMFDGCNTRFPLLLPVLDPLETTQRIVRAIRTNQRILYLPRILYLLTILKAVLPVDACLVLHKFFGATNFMDNFVGRKKNN